MEMSPAKRRMKTPLGILRLSMCAPGPALGRRGQSPAVAPSDAPQGAPGALRTLRASAAAAAAQRTAALPPQRRGQDAVAQASQASQASQDAGSAPLAEPLLRRLGGESPAAAQAPVAEALRWLGGEGPCGGGGGPGPGLRGRGAAAPLSSSCSFLRRLFLARPLGSIQLCPLSPRSPVPPGEVSTLVWLTGDSDL
ncbi:homeobox even-skipped homolog protein 2-like [Passer domesticus]|uniref:homeobox even-skipped homolog protein 2-like n=1 Tax=Passer domesticus TaxID=48849 RepID=UPI0030FE6AE2